MNVTFSPFLLVFIACTLIVQFGITLLSVLIFNRDGFFFYLFIILGDVCENQITLQMFLFSILKDETITTTFCV